MGCCGGDDEKKEVGGALNELGAPVKSTSTQILQISFA
jgi:hypothetical protein